MKKIIATAMLAVGSFIIAQAQCDKKFNLQADSVYQLQPDSSRGDLVPGHGTIKLTKDSIHVFMKMSDGNNFELKGKNTSTVCKMNATYSEGRIDLVYDAVLYAKGNEKNDKMFFTLTSKGGEMKLVGAPGSNMSDKLCFVINNKAEIK